MEVHPRREDCVGGDAQRVGDRVVVVPVEVQPNETDEVLVGEVRGELVALAHPPDEFREASLHVRIGRQRSVPLLLSLRYRVTPRRVEEDVAEFLGFLVHRVETRPAPAKNVLGPTEPVTAPVGRVEPPAGGGGAAIVHARWCEKI